MSASSAGNCISRSSLRLTVYDALMAAGEKHGIANAGYRAIESLRLEKGYRAWGADIGPDHSPLVAGLGWAVKLKSSTQFQGRTALEAQATKPLPRLLAGFTTDPSVVLLGRETIYRDGKRVGWLSPLDRLRLRPRCGERRHRDACFPAATSSKSPQHACRPNSSSTRSTTPRCRASRAETWRGSGAQGGFERSTRGFSVAKPKSAKQLAISARAAVSRNGDHCSASPINDRRSELRQIAFVLYVRDIFCTD